MKIVTATLALALLLAAPAAARPLPQDLRNPDTRDVAAARAQERYLMSYGDGSTAPAQDLRSPDARDAARTASRSVTPEQDLRSPDARDAAANPRVIGDLRPPTIGSPETPPASVPAKTGDGLDWAPIGLGLAGALFGLGGLSALAIRRTRRLRVVA